MKGHRMNPRIIVLLLLVLSSGFRTASAAQTVIDINTSGHSAIITVEGETFSFDIASELSECRSISATTPQDELDTTDYRALARSRFQKTLFSRIERLLADAGEQRQDYSRVRLALLAAAAALDQTDAQLQAAKQRDLDKGLANPIYDLIQQARAALTGDDPTL